MKSHLLIAAAHSGAGKTTVTLGLLKAMQRRGYRVQPFKCGPDFIDPLHHGAAAGRESINLDRFMMSDTHIQQIYQQYGSAADVSITEGVMGLYDGSRRMEGSSADLARLLQIPVILVLNAKAMAYTAAALIYGLTNFCKDIRIAGVIFNFVDSDSHYRYLQEACEDVGVRALGHLPAEPSLRIPSRYLGLDTSAETDRERIIDAAADHIEKHIGLDALLECTRGGMAADGADVEDGAGGAGAVGETDGADMEDGTEEAGGAGGADNADAVRGERTILVARDAAFNFIYPENIRRLEQFGTVRYFSPMRDRELPPADLLYLPGGYPEWHLEALAANQPLLQQVRDYYANGGSILAECGGMMYLGNYIADEKGKAWPMTGILNLATSVEHKKISLGYRVLCAPASGWTIKGHEFHYSQFAGTLPQQATAIEVINARGEPTGAPIFQQDRLFASYLHLYWAEQPEMLNRWFGW